MDLGCIYHMCYVKESLQTVELKEEGVILIYV